jgi:hypothetical protein
VPTTFVLAVFISWGFFLLVSSIFCLTDNGLPSRY